MEKLFEDVNKKQSEEIERLTAPYGRIDDTGRVELSQETMKKTGTDSVTLPAKTSGAPEMKIPMKKTSQVSACGSASLL